MGPADINPKPIAFKALSGKDAPAWASPLNDCIIQNASDPASRYATLATVDSSGKPHARTVVMRGCFADFNNPDYLDVISKRWDLWMITDARSQKIDDLHHEPWAEICWYFANPRIQFRLSGQIAIYRQDQCPIRQKAWELISEPAKAQFFWPESRKIRDGFHQHDFEISEIAVNPPESFVVLSISIDEVDQLNLNGTPQNRYLYQRTEDKVWSRSEINP